MQDSAHLFILLVITLSMLAFIFANAVRDSLSFKVFEALSFVFAVVLLIRIWMGPISLLYTALIKALLSILVILFFLQTKKTLEPVPSAADFASDS